MTEDEYYARVKNMGLRKVRTSERSDIFISPSREYITVPHPGKLTPEQCEATIERLRTLLGTNFPNYRGPH